MSTKEFAIENFKPLLREFIGKPEFEGIALEYQQRSGKPMPLFLGDILNEYGGKFADPYMALEIVLRMALRTSTQVSAFEAKISQFQNSLGAQASSRRFNQTLKRFSRALGKEGSREKAPKTKTQKVVKGADGTTHSDAKSGRSTKGKSPKKARPKKKIKIVALSANPLQTTRLNLDKEIREIAKELNDAKLASRFEFKQHLAVEVEELQRILIREKPAIIHFCGHGSSESEIILEDRAGGAHPVTPAALGDLFRLLGGDVRCVIFNACYSKRQAAALVDHIECVIGMAGPIGDQSAIAFATGFYRGIGEGKSVSIAFAMGQSQMRLQNFKGFRKPQMLTRAGVDPATVMLAE